MAPSTSENMGGSAREAAGDGRILARALGYVSVGLGLAELAAPQALASFVGVAPPLARAEQTRRVLRLLGARELTSGVGLLAQRRHFRPWAWSRVAGDIMDLTILGVLMGMRKTDQRRMAWAIGAVTGVTALDVLASLGLGRRRIERALTGRQTVRKAITIRRTPDEVYRFWRELDNLPRFMAHVDQVTRTTEQRSHWVVRAPAGRTVEWDAEIVADRPGERLAWRALPGADIEHEGLVRFVKAPGDRGTEVHVELTYRAPGGGLGAALARLFGEEPEQQLDGDLRRLKQVLEAGEVMQSDASLASGRHPAQPDPALAEPLGVRVTPPFAPLPVNHSDGSRSNGHKEHR